ncbi:MAG: hypothetical protein Q7S60_01805 [bacterium]|nr:hypothetical protein [bacterium]
MRQLGSWVYPFEDKMHMVPQPQNPSGPPQCIMSDPIYFARGSGLLEVQVVLVGEYIAQDPDIAFYRSTVIATPVGSTFNIPIKCGLLTPDGCSLASVGYKRARTHVFESWESQETNGSNKQVAPACFTFEPRYLERIRIRLSQSKVAAGTDRLLATMPVESLMHLA